MITVLTVARNDRPIDYRVDMSLANQGPIGNRVILPTPYSPNKRKALKNIVKGRNVLRGYAGPGYVFWHDADVVLPTGCLSILHECLQRDPGLGAMGCNYGDTDPTGQHVGFGALMVRSHLVQSIAVRSARGRCECSCFADDVRQMGWRVEYHPTLRAEHLGGG